MAYAVVPWALTTALIRARVTKPSRNGRGAHGNGLKQRGLSAHWRFSAAPAPRPKPSLTLMGRNRTRETARPGPVQYKWQEALTFTP